MRCSARCARESFDLYILDWHLPDTDGLQVLKEIRTSVPAALVSNT